MNLSAAQWPSAEIPSQLTPRPQIRHVLFDFDGTLTLIRQGWPEVMVGMFVEMLPRLASDTDESLQTLVLDDIMRLNGKRTIYQMMQLADRVRERGGEPREPLWYKHEYLRRLELKIANRTTGIADGSIPRTEYLVHAARPFLDHLKTCGLTLYLASGTDEYAVRREAELLGVLEDFGPRVYDPKLSEKPHLNHPHRACPDGLLAYAPAVIVTSLLQRPVNHPRQAPWR